MNELVTLQEMAARLKVSAKTFSQCVRDQQIPYVLAGKGRRFDPAEVIAKLKRVEKKDNVAEFKPTVRKSRTKSKFAEACGL